MFLFFNLIHFDILGMSPMFHVVYPSQAKVCGDCQEVGGEGGEGGEGGAGGGVFPVVVQVVWYDKGCGDCQEVPLVPGLTELGGVAGTQITGGALCCAKSAEVQCISTLYVSLCFSVNYWWRCVIIDVYLHASLSNISEDVSLSMCFTVFHCVLL